MFFLQNDLIPSNLIIHQSEKCCLLMLSCHWFDSYPQRLVQWPSNCQTVLQITLTTRILNFLSSCVKCQHDLLGTSKQNNDRWCGPWGLSTIGWCPFVNFDPVRTRVDILMNETMAGKDMYSMWNIVRMLLVLPLTEIWVIIDTAVITHWPPYWLKHGRNL